MRDFCIPFIANTEDPSRRPAAESLPLKAENEAQSAFNLEAATAEIKTR
jgi:hypothetical protein